jgi:four helix bundle protein
MQNYKNLEVWKTAHSLAVNVYKSTNSFPKDELYGLTSQVRRACVSIPANIAEGCGRGGNSELGQFLKIALGSANELEYELLLAKDLTYLKADIYDNLNKQVNEIKGMLISLIKKVSLKT